MEHRKCLLCGRTVGRLPLHLYQIHAMTVEQYYRQKPEARPVELDATSVVRTPFEPGDSPLNQKIMQQFPWGKDLIQNSLDAGVSKGSVSMSVLKIAHRSRRNFNELVGNVQFSFGSTGVATVSINHRYQRDMLAMRPGFFVPEEEESKKVVPLAPLKAKKEEEKPKPAFKTVPKVEAVVEEESEEEAEEVDEEGDSSDEYTERKAFLENLSRPKLLQEAKRVGIKSFGLKTVKVIELILDEEFEDAEE